MRGYICIHGHFYQPPRENPWLERIEVQESAAPYHDWNARVSAECYAPNAVSRILDTSNRITGIFNNYEHISFNFGPTLLSWLSQYSPDIYQKILQADKMSCDKRNGHGNAMAQAYNHMIMPLANRRDKITQVAWGIRSFLHHFGRQPEGMWLPETAVDLETLEIMADHGIRFTLLAPRQARRVRPLSTISWLDVSDGTISTSVPYTVQLPSGGSMAIFFYNGGIAHDLAFGGLLQNAENFVKILFDAAPQEHENRPPLIHIATDGESYGHHHRFGDMALSYALDQVNRNPSFQLTNYGEYLCLHPPDHEVEIISNSSWSCAHGVERWRSDCGCRADAGRGWNQKWRKPLRESLDWLRYELIGLYGSYASRYFHDAWQARNDYIDVVIDSSDTARNNFFSRHAVKNLNRTERTTALQLLEIQRNAMLMYTSCGWFFDEISGIETVQILCYAARALELAKRVTGVELEDEFCRHLHEAPSNLEAMANGAEIYKKFALAAKAHLKEVASHFAISSFFEDYQRKNTLGCYNLELLEYNREQLEQSFAAVGKLHAKSAITEEEAFFVFAALQQEHHEYYCAVKECASGETTADMDRHEHSSADNLYNEVSRELFLKMREQGLSAALKVISDLFGDDRYTIKDLFKDEQQDLLDLVLREELEFIGRILEPVYDKTSFLTSMLKECGRSIPPPFAMAAEVSLQNKLIAAIEDSGTSQDTIRLLLDEINRWQIDLDQDWLERTLRQRVENEMAALRAKPDVENLQQMNSLLSMLYLFPVKINLWQTQNCFFDLMHSLYLDRKKAAENNDSAAGQWLEQFTRLGVMLFINVEKAAAGLESDQKKLRT